MIVLEEKLVDILHIHEQIISYLCEKYLFIKWSTYAWNALGAVILLKGEKYWKLCIMTWLYIICSGNIIFWWGKVIIWSGKSITCCGNIITWCGKVFICSVNIILFCGRNNFFVYDVDISLNVVLKHLLISLTCPPSPCSAGNQLKDVAQNVDCFLAGGNRAPVFRIPFSNWKSRHLRYTASELSRLDVTTIGYRVWLQSKVSEFIRAAEVEHPPPTPLSHM